MKPAQYTAIIPHIIDQHAEEAAFLWLLRNNAVSEAHYNLEHLQRLEERIEAHLDGLRVAGTEGWQRCLENLQQHPESGEMFAATTLAFESDDTARLQTLYTLAEANPDTERGLISALGWVEPQHLQGKVSGMLSAPSPFWRRIGIAACAIHRVNPGKHLEAALHDPDPALCCRALKACGELGRNDLRDLIARHLPATDPNLRYWSAWALTLLGNRSEAPAVLQTYLMHPGQYAEPAARLVFRTTTPQDAQHLLSALIKQHHNLRLAIQSAGITGDSRYIPWLIQQMSIPEHARVAGEAFSLITGIDLAYDDLETDQPANFHAGPTESPADDNTALDSDENLPWPDPALIQHWWQQHQHAFPGGQRYLMGKPVTAEHCQTILNSGMQRQRHAAALELALMAPKTPLFETRAKVAKVNRP
ncbi:MAG: TIGR02270 family protein [Thiothrix litoralis]